MIRFIAPQRPCPQKRDEPENLQQIRLPCTIRVDWQSKAPRLQNNILRGAEASNVDLLNGIGSRILCSQ